MQNLLEVRDLKMHFPVLGGVLRRKVATVFAVDGVSFDVKPGETVGLVGESGCGKTTVGRALSRLYEPTSGTVQFNGKDLLSASKSEMIKMRRDMQIIFQDPYESLNSRHTVGRILEEPFIIHKIGSKEEREAEVKRLLARVGLPPSAIEKYPHEFSGGQRQRIGIARAIALKPKLIICDEPVSALDVSVQSQVINLLLELQEEMKLSYLFIAHDLAVVRHISDKVAVMYLGKIVEFTDADTIYENPKHPYTKALIASIPLPDPKMKKTHPPLQGDVPSPINPPSGCNFHTRCPVATDICRQKIPVLKESGANPNKTHQVACHLI